MVCTDYEMSKANKGKGKGRNAVSDDFGPPLQAPRRNAPAAGPQPAVPTAPTGAWATPAAPQPITSTAPTGAWARPAASNAGRNPAPGPSRAAASGHSIASVSGQSTQSSANQRAARPSVAPSAAAQLQVPNEPNSGAGGQIQPVQAGNSNAFIFALLFFTEIRMLICFSPILFIFSIQRTEKEVQSSVVNFVRVANAPNIWKLLRPNHPR